jgi:hypothetical protein
MDTGRLKKMEGGGKEDEYDKNEGLGKEVKKGKELE